MTTPRRKHSQTGLETAYIVRIGLRIAGDKFQTLGRLYVYARRRPVMCRSGRMLLIPNRADASRQHADPGEHTRARGEHTAHTRAESPLERSAVLSELLSHVREREPRWCAAAVAPTDPSATHLPADGR